MLGSGVFNRRWWSHFKNARKGIYHRGKDRTGNTKLHKTICPPSNMSDNALLNCFAGRMSRRSLGRTWPDLEKLNHVMKPWSKATSSRKPITGIHSETSDICELPRQTYDVLKLHFSPNHPSGAFGSESVFLWGRRVSNCKTGIALSEGADGIEFLLSENLSEVKMSHSRKFFLYQCLRRDFTHGEIKILSRSPAWATPAAAPDTTAGPLWNKESDLNRFAVRVRTNRDARLVRRRRKLPCPSLAQLCCRMPRNGSRLPASTAVSAR